LAGFGVSLPEELNLLFDSVTTALASLLLQHCHTDRALSAAFSL
jgi:hypothetical protein